MIWLVKIVKKTLNVEQYVKELEQTKLDMSLRLKKVCPVYLIRPFQSVLSLSLKCIGYNSLASVLI